MISASELIARAHNESRRHEGNDRSRAHAARLQIRERRLSRRIERVRAELDHLTR